MCKNTKINTKSAPMNLKQGTIFNTEPGCSARRTQYPIHRTVWDMATAYCVRWGRPGCKIEIKISLSLSLSFATIHSKVCSIVHCFNNQPTFVWMYWKAYVRLGSVTIRSLSGICCVTRSCWNVLEINVSHQTKPYYGFNLSLLSLSFSLSLSLSLFFTLF
jgi:uncharacterized integral membrane protein